MKKLKTLVIQALCVTFCFGWMIQSPLFAGSIPWRTDLKAAAKESVKTNQPMLMKFSATWCYPCKKLKKSFEQENVAKQVNGHFIPVLVDADHNSKLMQAIGVEKLPTTVIITPQYEVILKIVGYYNANDLEKKLEKYCQVEHTIVQPAIAIPKVGPYRQPVNMVQADRQKLMSKISRPFTSASVAGSQLKQTEKTVSSVPPTPTKTAQLEDPFNRVSDFNTEIPLQQPLQAKAEINTKQMAQRDPLAKSNAGFQAVTPPDVTLPAVVSENKISPPRKTIPVIVDVKKEYAFSGLCLVSLLDERFLTEGSAKQTAKYNGVTLCFASKEYKEIFEKNPAKYWPVKSGLCIISLLEQNTKRQGDPETGAVFRGKLWFFSNAEIRQKFANSPSKYAREIQ